MTRARNIAGFSTITTTPSPVHVGPIGVLTATRIDGEFNQVDLATRNITAAGIAATNLQVSGITTGLNVSGIITAQNGINFNGTSTGLNVSGVGTIATLSVTGNATVGGVLTYEDVTRVDSVGVITAREQVHVGTGVSIAAGGLNVTAGISTFGGDVSIADKIVHTGDTNTAIRFPAADTITAETAGSERLRIDDNGKVLIATSTTSEAHANQDELIIGSSSDDANHGLTIVTPSSRYGTVAYSDGSGGTSQGLLEYNHSSDFFRIYTAGAEKLRITSGGFVMIGTTTEGFATYGDKFTIADSGHCGMTIRSGTSNYGTIYFSDADDGSANEVRGFVEYNHSNNALSLGSNGTMRLRINSDGNVLINTTATPTGYGNLNIFGTDNIGSRLAIRRGSADANGPQIWFNKSRNTTDGSHTVVQSGDLLGSIVFTGNDSQGPEFSARIMCEVDGTPGSNDMPGRLVFSTTPDGSDTLAEALRLTSDKIVNIAGQGSVFGRLNVPVATQSGGSAIQVMNTAGGSGDGTLTNIALRSVNSTGSQWAHAEYRAHSHKFLHQGTTKVTINTNGLCFNSDTAAANALNDYEEGVFTVTLANSLTVGTQTQLRYTKIGDKVHITGQFRVTSGGSDLIVSNLPFTTLATGSTDEAFSVGIVGLYYVTMPTDGNASGEVLTKTQKNDTNLYFIYNRNNTDPNSHHATTNGYYTVSHWYTTA